MPHADPARPLPGTARDVEVELARRVFHLAIALGVGTTLMYVLVFSLRGVLWQALGNGALTLFMLAIGRHAARARDYARCLAWLAWPVFAALATVSFWQNGISGAAVWWLVTLPLVLLQGGATRAAVAMAGLVMALVVLLVVLGQRQLLPAPTAMPLGEIQRAISIIGSLLFAMLLSLLSTRWRRELLEHLDRARAEADDALRVKSRFLANMSHEIRTPLNGIVGATELMQGTALDAGQQRMLAVMNRSTEALMALVNDVLDFSKLEAGRVAVERVAFDLHDAVHDVAEVFGAQAQAKGLELSAHCTHDLPRHALGDPARLRQILHNLVANAVKFTAEGEVRLVAAPEFEGDGSPWLRISVRDTGIGMDEAQRRRLFAAFAQGDVSTTRRFGGSGLGLAISRELATLMGGRIDVNSQAGRGSTFVLQLPLSRIERPAPARPDLSGVKALLVSPTPSLRDDLAALLCQVGASGESRDTLPDAAALARARQRGIKLVVCDERSLANATLPRTDWQARVAGAGLRSVLLTGLSVRSAELPQGLTPLYKPASPQRVFEALSQALKDAPDEAAADTLANRPDAPRARLVATRNRHVLLAEDNPVNQLVAQGMLERLGLNVTIAADGLQALRHFEQRAANEVGTTADGFGLVLMDCHMPELDGLACTRRMREIEVERDWPRTPVVAMTASSGAESVQACRDAGMDGFLPKPVAYAELEEMVVRWMN